MGIMSAKMGTLKKKRRGGELFANFTTHTFTTAGKVGRHGPTLAEMRAAYAATSWASNNSFFFQGRAQGYQVFQIPTDGIYEIEIAGSRGQTSSSGTPSYGRGAILKARISFTTSDKLEMVVGQLPESGNINSVSSAAGAGGGSFVGLYGTNTPIIVAGGGAGAYSTWTSQAIVNGQTRRQPTYSGYSYSPSASGTNPSLGYGGRGYHGGGGGGWFGGGEDYPTNPNSTAVGTDLTAQQYTHGASFVGSAISGGTGPFYSTGGSGNQTAPGLQGGFGGGGAGHTGNNSGGGGGGGYSGGLGGQTSMGGSYLSGIGGGSFIISNATNVATSDGNFDGSSTFNGGAITNLGTFNDGAGYIKITLISANAAAPITYNSTNMNIISNPTLRGDSKASPASTSPYYIFGTNNNGESFTIDVGSAKKLTSWSCNNTSQGNGYNWSGGVVQCSNDNTNWTTIDSFGLNENVGTVSHTVNNNTTGRYWRFYQTTACSTGTMHLWNLVMNMV